MNSSGISVNSKTPDDKRHGMAFASEANASKSRLRNREITEK
jgi:hypothetical protein